jgi:hypothetical protein
MISLPDIREAKGCVVWGFIAQLHVGENSRFAQESVGVQPEPQA